MGKDEKERDWGVYNSPEEFEAARQRALNKRGVN
jgi:hypothetical protein